MLTALLIALAPPALAQEAVSPEALVKKVTAEVLKAIQEDPSLQAGDRAKALALAEEKVLPHVDFQRMTSMAAGRVWRVATPAQRERMVKEFRAMLIRTYATAIDAYRGQTMKVLPVRMAKGDTEVTVRNQYRSPGNPPVEVQYDMHRTPEGWKIFDIVVGGISLVITYRGEFDHLERTSGVEGLLQALASKNAPAKR
jgi:phospholipid transport system substrate-binding protein